MRVRHVPGAARILAMLTAVVLVSCSSPTEPEPLPGLPAVDPATVVFIDTFANENGGQGVYNWEDFEHWDVVAGCVDLHGNGFWDVIPKEGLYVDMDGSCFEAGTLQTKEAYDLDPGLYVLEFGLAGNHRHQVSDTMDVSFGALYEERFELAWNHPYTQYERMIDVGAAASARIRFEHHGGDNRGILLADIRLRRVE